MAKKIFRYGEFTFSDNVVNITSHVDSDIPESMELEEIEEQYKGPDLDELRQEAALFKVQWEEEKSKMEQDAQAEAKQIIQKTQSNLRDEAEKHAELLQKKSEEANNEAKMLVENARNESERLLNETHAKVEELKDRAYRKSVEEGRAEGYESGLQEVERLTSRLHTIIDKTIEQRNKIIQESESQLVQLTLQIAKKVIKILSEKQRSVVINNVIHALKKIKTRADVVIRVNLADLQVTSNHKKNFIDRIEGLSNITVMEDSTVDPGGAIIETDFGQIDARITSQFQKIEEAIIELMPTTIPHRQRE